MGGGLSEGKKLGWSTPLEGGSMERLTHAAASVLPPVSCLPRSGRQSSSWNGSTSASRTPIKTGAPRRQTPMETTHTTYHNMRGGAREASSLPSTRHAGFGVAANRDAGSIRPHMNFRPTAGSRSTLSGGSSSSLAHARPRNVAALHPVTSMSLATAAPAPAVAAAVPTSAQACAPKSCDKCDKCDGGHSTDRCPFYKKARDNHPDAKPAREKKMLGLQSGPPEILRIGSARVIRQPGDGSCLFHSLSHGLKDGSSASSLRKQVAEFIQSNPTLEISDSPLKDWVRPVASPNAPLPLLRTCSPPRRSAPLASCAI
jgi:hypothetical protein